MTTTTDLEDFTALDPFFRILEQGVPRVLYIPPQTGSDDAPRPTTRCTGCPAPW
jgi:hypothetical protein